MDNRDEAAVIAGQVYIERAAKCTPQARAAAREFLDLRNGAGFGEELRIDGITLACQRTINLTVEVDGGAFHEAEFNPHAWVCAAIERGLAYVDFGGCEAYGISPRREV